MTRHRIRRSRLLILASVVTLPLATGHARAQATAAGVLLRYHFVAGAHFGDQITSAVTATVAASGATPAQTSRSVAHTTARYHILRVAANGNATAKIQISRTTVSVTTGGKTLTRTLPAHSTTATLRPDGSAHATSGAGPLTVGVQSIGLLPSGAVTVGAHWTSRASVTLSTAGTGLPAIHLTAKNTLTGYRTYTGQRVAVLTTASAVQYVTDSTLQGTPVHMHITGTVAGQSLFGLAARRVLQSHAHEDLRLFLHGTSATTGAVAAHEHIVFDVTVRDLAP